MSVAARLERLACDLAATKARPSSDDPAVEELAEQLRGLFSPALERIAGRAQRDGIPTDPTSRRAWLTELEDLADELLATVAPDALNEVIAGREKVLAAVAQHKGATKAFPEFARPMRRGETLSAYFRSQNLRPYGADRKLYQQLSGVSDRMLQRMVARTASALADAATDPAVLADTFESLLENELKRMSRHVLRDAHETAVIDEEKAQGVRYHQWRTAADDRVRDTHADVDGEIVRIGEKFSNGWRYPGQIGCRCTVEPWFPPPGTSAPDGRFRAGDVTATA